MSILYMSRLRVCCAIINLQGKTLIVQRGENMKLPVKWEFPGGKIEGNESETDCVVREIKEELNIEIEVEKRLDSSLFEYPDFSIELIPFIAKYISGQVSLKEHQQYLLLEKEELAKLDWADADISIVKQYLSL